MSIKFSIIQSNGVVLYKTNNTKDLNKMKTLLAATGTNMRNIFINVSR